MAKLKLFLSTLFQLGIGTRLDENLGQIEKVKDGYIVIRESASLKSLNFLKNLKEIKPLSLPDLVNYGLEKPILYNDRYVQSVVVGHLITHLLHKKGMFCTYPK